MPAALLVTGTVGAGKTTVAEAAGDLLTSRKVPNAVIDLDWLRRAWPGPPGDRFNGGLALRNLAAVVPHFLAAGAERLILAGVVETREERRSYEEALAMPLTVALLRVPRPTVHSRLRHRHVADPDGLSWHLKRSPELDAILTRAGVEDFAVDAGELPAAEVARAVLAGAGW